MDERLLKFVEELAEIKDQWENGILTEHEANFQSLALINKFNAQEIWKDL